MSDEKPWGAFCDLIGASARNRVLEVFLEGWEIDNSFGNAAEESSLNRATVYNVAEELLKERVLVPTRKVGRAQLYKLNTDNESVKALIKIFNLALKIVEKEVQREMKNGAEKAIASHSV